MCQPQNVRRSYITCPWLPQPLLGNPFYQCPEQNRLVLQLWKSISRPILQPTILKETHTVGPLTGPESSPLQG